MGILDRSPFPVPLRFCRDRLPKFRGPGSPPFPRSHVSARRRFAFLVLPCAFRSRTSPPTPTPTALVSLRCAALHCFEVFRHPCFWFLVSTDFLIESCPLFIDWERKLLMLSSWSCRFIYFCNLFLCVVVVVVVCCRWRGFCRDMAMCPNEPGWSKMGYIISSALRRFCVAVMG